MIPYNEDPFHPANSLGVNAPNATAFNPNEQMGTHKAAAEEIIEQSMRNILGALCIDLEDPNVKGTPKRYAKMLVREVCRGRFDPPPPLTSFPNTKQLDELVATGPIAVRSLCSHHFCPITGRCWIGYVPGKRVLGLSKFNRVVEWFAARPQIQEELTVQIADFIEQELQPQGVAVWMVANHSCMTWRGVRETSDAEMTTSVMRGIFREQPEARAEFLAVVKR